MLASKNEIDNPQELFLTYIVQLVFFGMSVVQLVIAYLAIKGRTQCKSPENGELMASLI